MNKMTKPTMFLILLLAPVMLYAGGENNVNSDKNSALREDKEKGVEIIKPERDDFYARIESKAILKKQDIDLIRGRGYSPFFNFVTLLIAKEAGLPVSGVLKMVEDGYSWGDMCVDYGIDYEKFVTRIEDIIKKHNLIFPVSTADEDARDSATMPYKRTKVPE